MTSGRSESHGKQAIIQAAGELICHQGVAQTSISQLRQASGMSAGAIYHHFANKNAIVVAVARNAIEWPLAALEGYRDRPASPGQLLEYVARTLETFPEIGDLMIQLGAGSATDDELGELLHDEFKVLSDSVGLTVAAWAAQTQPDPDPAAVNDRTQLLIGTILGLLLQRRLLPTFDVDSYVREAKAVLDVAL